MHGMDNRKRDVGNRGTYTQRYQALIFSSLHHLLT